MVEATDPRMQWLARIALTQGFSQESLAKRLCDEFGLAVNGKNVYEYLTARRPQRVTLERFAKVLGAVEGLRKLEGGPLSEERLRLQEEKLFRLLDIFRAEFTRNVRDSVAKVLRVPRVRSEVLTAEDLSQPFTELQAAVAGLSGIPGPLRGFATALAPYLDLQNYVRVRSKGDSALFVLYSEALDLYGNEAKARAFIDACAAVFRIDGYDTEPMYEFLHDSLAGTAAAAAVESSGKRTRVAQGKAGKRL